MRLLKRVLGTPVTRVGIPAGALVLFASTSFAQSTPAPRDPRPTIAVMWFTGGSLKRPGDYAALGRGIAELLTTQLAANDDVRVAERQRLDDLLNEQQLSASAEVDAATAVRLGRVLGVRHFITGGFLIDTKDHMRLDVRSVNVETSELEYRDRIEGGVGDVFALIDQVERKLSAGIRLMPGTSGARSSAAGAKGDEALALTQLGRATAAIGKGDTTTALSAVREALKASPDLRAGKALESAITKSSISHP